MVEFLFQSGTPCRPEPELDVNRGPAGLPPAERRSEAGGLHSVVQVRSRKSVLSCGFPRPSTVSNVRVGPKPKEPVTDLHEPPIDAEVKVADVDALP